VKFIEYPTRQDYQERKNGEELEGQITSPAPGGGKWVVTPDQKFHRVRTRWPEKSYSIAEEPP
jgi:hypothetical protein